MPVPKAQMMFVEIKDDTRQIHTFKAGDARAAEGWRSAAAAASKAGCDACVEHDTPCGEKPQLQRRDEAA